MSRDFTTGAVAHGIARFLASLPSERGARVLGLGDRQVSVQHLAAARDLGAEHAEERREFPFDAPTLWTVIVGEAQDEYELGSYGILVEAYQSAIREFW